MTAVIKRILCFLLIMSMLSVATACQGTDSPSSAAKVVRPGEQETPEITILMTQNISDWMKKDYFKEYKNQFEQQYGVKVNYETYGSEYEINASELMAKLSVKGGPELIIDDAGNASKLIAQGAVLDTKTKIENTKKIYPALLNDGTYFIPIGIELEVLILKRDVLEALNQPIPNMDWTVQDYYRIRNTWREKTPRLFTSRELSEIVWEYLDNLKLFDLSNKKANLNTSEMKECLRNIRKDIFSGDYILKKNYSYENYYNMQAEPTSLEFTKDIELRRSDEYNNQHFRNLSGEANVNALYARDINRQDMEKSIILPKVISMEKYLWSFGYMVNKNGKNLELAYEYINGLLSDDMQLKMYADEKSKIYPVNQSIEVEIAAREKNSGNRDAAITVKNRLFDEVKNGHYKLIDLRDRKERVLNEMLIKDLYKYIFADEEYTDQELSAELQKLEDKYNIWMTE